jgi:hypothetical protein
LAGSSQFDDRISSLQVENTLLTETTERLRSYIAELENDLSLHKTSSSSPSHSLSQTHHHRHASSSSTSTSLIQQTDHQFNSDHLQSYNEIILQLKHELLLKDELLIKERTRHESTKSEYQKEIESLKCDKNNLLSELKLRPERKEFNELKKQLVVIQNVLFHTVEEVQSTNTTTATGMMTRGSLEEQEGDGAQEEEEEDMDDMKKIQFPSELMGGSQQHRHHHSKPAGGLMKLESMLVARLKCLEHELAENRVTLETLHQNEEIARKRVLELEQSLFSSQTLITQLETDLESHVLNTSTAVLLSGGGKGGKDKLRDHQNVDPSLVQLLSESGEGYDRSSSRSTQKSSERGAGGGPENSNTSTVAGQQQMISILQAQRDRYKERLENVSEVC